MELEDCVARLGDSLFVVWAFKELRQKLTQWVWGYFGLHSVFNASLKWAMERILFPNPTKQNKNLRVVKYNIKHNYTATLEKLHLEIDPEDNSEWLEHR